MKKQVLLTLMSILSLYCHSQIKYENGYFINNEGEKINCLIKNIDWKNHPIEFTYKLIANSESKTANIKSVIEFGILNFSKFKRFTVDIDRSSEKFSLMSTNKAPEFNKEQLFLKVLVEGKATLYYYEDRGDLRRFFYTLDNSTIEPLIFKSYKISESSFNQNDTYKQQLWKNFNCGEISMRKVDRIRYDNRDLVNFFTGYNKCQNSESAVYSKKEKGSYFNLNFRPGLNISTLSFQNISSTSYDFGTKLNLRAGIEAEFILPFNKNKWAVIVEPNFQYFKSEKTTNNKTATVDYKLIELSLGARHSFFLTDISKIFINGSYIHELSLNSEMSYDNINNLTVKGLDNIAFGLGYNRQKYSLEMRYATSRDITADYPNWDSKYQTFSIIFGYNIF